ANAHRVVRGARGEPALGGHGREHPRGAERQAYAVGGLEDGVEPGHGDARGEERALGAARAAGCREADEEAGTKAASVRHEGQFRDDGAHFQGDSPMPFSMTMRWPTQRDSVCPTVSTGESKPVEASSKRERLF